MRTSACHMVVLASALAFAAVGAEACSRGEAAKPSAGDPTSVFPPFQPDPPAVYVPKVKNVLTGIAATPDEIAQVEADPAALGTLVDGWVAQPEYETKLRTFFALAFQQTQITSSDFAGLIPGGNGIGYGSLVSLLMQNVRESFARTVIELVKEGRPLTEAMTTHRFMMTPPLMELYAYLDTSQVNDDETVNDLFAKAYKGAQIQVGSAPVAYTDSINPASPSFLHFGFPDLAKAPQTVAGCDADPRVFPVSAHTIHVHMYGDLEQYKSPTKASCANYANPADAVFTAADFQAWRMVTIRQPAAGEATTRFYDADALRVGNEIVASTPRVGFFSTPAFFANWQTNKNNQMRVTINQTLIVATGQSVDGTDTTAPSSTPGLDAAHAAPGTACFDCHQTLDPTRSILASTYSYGYGNQNDGSAAAQKGLFAFRGVVAPVNDVDDFANVLATHPSFGLGWTQKLCAFVDSQPCDASDPEVQRVVSVFQKSGYSWPALVHELVTSPLTTNAKPTKTTTENGVTVAVTRRDHLCAELDARLGLVDVCGLDLLGGGQARGAFVPTIAGGLPSDGYGRGAVLPVMPNQPTLFYRAATENICEAVADMVVDAAKPPAGAKRYSSASPDDAIADFVSTLMGLPPDGTRGRRISALLHAHFTDAQAQGASPTDALKSTFVAACLSPSVVGMGM